MRLRRHPRTAGESQLARRQILPPGCQHCIDKRQRVVRKRVIDEQHRSREEYGRPNWMAFLTSADHASRRGRAWRRSSRISAVKIGCHPARLVKVNGDGNQQGRTYANSVCVRSGLGPCGLAPIPAGWRRHGAAHGAFLAPPLRRQGDTGAVIAACHFKRRVLSATGTGLGRRQQDANRENEPQPVREIARGWGLSSAHDACKSASSSPVREPDSRGQSVVRH